MFKQQHDKGSLPWWMYLCRWLWKVTAFLGTTILLPLALNVVSTWLTNSKGIIPTDSPFGWLLTQWPLVLLTGCCLLLLALLTWIISQWPISTETSLSWSQQERARMLEALRNTYDKMLKGSLGEAARIDLGLAETPDAVRNTATLLLHIANQSKRSLPTGASILDAYDQAGYEMLILGKPGAGKTTLLSDLALQLVRRAKIDPTHPLPVILPLSTWTVKHLSLEDWLVEELTRVHRVPRQLSKEWVRDEAILPLLDGLDEIDRAVRPACIAAINAYYYKHHLHVPLIVCSRKDEYEISAKRQRLTLQNAVEIQPLTHAQVDTYLIEAGQPLEALRRALKNNTSLRDLATNPLTLSVLMLTYQGTKVRELPKKQAMLQQQIWNDYIKHMVHRKGDQERYSLEQVCSSLGWLARQMRIRSQMTLYLEQLQPDWLPKKQKILYRCSVVLVIIFIIVLFQGLSWTIVFGFGGLLLHKLDQEPFRRLLVGLLGALPLELTAGASFGLFFGLRAIQPSEALDWSWKDIWSRAFIGSLIGLSGIAFFIMFRRLTTISGKQLIERIQLFPNEGIQRSAKNGLHVGLLIGFPVGLLVGLLLGLPAGLAFGVLEGLFYGLFSGSLIGLFFGLGAFIQHYVLRFWLWNTRLLPWRAVHFLDDATTRILLQPNNGGYSYIHRLLLDYFADFDQ